MITTNEYSSEQSLVETNQTQSTPMQPVPPQNYDSKSDSVFVTGTSPVIPGSSGNPQVPFVWGPIAFHPSLAYRFSYGNGIHSSPGNQHNTIYQEVSPGIGMDLGDHWKLSYTPRFAFYSDPDFKDTLNHFVNLTGGTVYNDWALRFSQRCALTSEPRVETASQTDRQIYGTSLGATYQINRSMTLDLGLSQNFSYVGGGFTNSVGSSKNWFTMDWLNYHWGDNLAAGLGLGAGYDAVERGSDTTYQEYQGRVLWRLLQKVSLSLSGGAHTRQFLDSAQSDLISPVFDVALTYNPFETTALTLSFNRSVSQSSYYVNQITEATGFSAALSQRLLGRLHLGLSGGYESTSYKESVPGYSAFGVNRQDDRSFVHVSLDTGFLKRGTASIFYSHSSNTSNAGGYSYDSDQYGFQLAYRY